MVAKERIYPNREFFILARSESVASFSARGVGIGARKREFDNTGGEDAKGMESAEG